MENRTFKKSYLILAGVLLFLGLGGFLLYKNRASLYPTVKGVKYLQVGMAHDTALVKAGLLVQNWSPVPFRIDSVNYIIRNKGVKLGWGGQVVGKSFSPFGDRLLNFRLYLKSENYLEHLAKVQGEDSLDLDVAMSVYYDLPFRKPDTLQINRTVTTAIPKAPAFEIDTLLLKSFTPKGGYVFLMQLNTGNTNLPNLKLSDVKYDIHFADSTIIDGRIDSTFTLKEGEATVQVPLRLETTEMVALIRKKLSGKKRWFYKARASALARTDHPLFKKLKVSISKKGSLAASEFSNDKMAMPSIKQIKSLVLESHEKQTFLKAALIINNPTPIPIYIDSAHYSILYAGKKVAGGDWNYEKTLPKNGNKELALRLAINNQRYKQMMQQAKNRHEIPVQIKLDLIYDLKNHGRQKLSFNEKIRVPVPETGGIEVAGLKVKELDPEKGASLLLKLQVQNNKVAGLEVANFQYKVLLGKDLEISGKTTEALKIDKGISEVEVPLKLSANDVNLLVKRLLQGNQDWHYQFAGSAVVSSENGMLQHSKIALQTHGELDTGSDQKQNLVPAITGIDSLAFTIHYDSAWVRLHLNVYNPLPVNITVQQLSLDLKQENQLIGRLNEQETHVLTANDTTAAWLDLKVDYALWEKHINEHQQEDSLQLSIPLMLTFSIGNLPAQQVPLQLKPKIIMPYSPVTVLQKTRFAGFTRAGLKFNGEVLVQNANVKNLELKETTYKIALENGVDMCGTINRTYQIPLDQSHANFPFSLSLVEAVKMGYRQFFGSPKLNYKINATTHVSTSSPKLKSFYLTFENHNVTDLKEKKQPTKRVKKEPQQRVAQQ